MKYMQYMPEIEQSPFSFFFVPNSIDDFYMHGEEYIYTRPYGVLRVRYNPSTELYLCYVYERDERSASFSEWFNKAGAMACVRFFIDGRWPADPLHRRNEELIREVKSGLPKPTRVQYQEHRIKLIYDNPFSKTVITYNRYWWPSPRYTFTFNGRTVKTESKKECLSLLTSAQREVRNTLKSKEHASYEAFLREMKSKTTQPKEKP